MDSTSSYYEPVPEEPQPEEKSRTWLYVVLGVVIVILVGMFIWLLLGGSQPSEPPPPTPAPEDQSWARIEQAGVLRIGTAADYQPFEYYNDQRQIDGFDIALVKAMADRLGVRAEITDFAFEGLGAALQVGQVDVLISALSVTQEREAIADFSNVYYVGEDGVLAAADSDIEEVKNLGDFAGKRVGVQKATVYEDWGQTSLVAAGIISQDQLFVYAQPVHALNDLVLDRLDLVVMDLQPATTAAIEMEVKLVGRGLQEQRFAIAAPQGSVALVEQLNNALTTLQNDGTISRLYSDYLNLRPEDIPPLPTPEPTATAQPTPTGCVNGMEYIRDLSYDDKDFTDLPKLNPGESFAKGWRIKNTGTCNWEADYYLGFDRGDRMGGENTFLDNVVKPGQTYDIWVDLVAPNAAGEYAGAWQMHDSNKVPFGEIIWVAIQVLGPTAVPTETPAPTNTPPVEPTETTEPPPEPTPTATEHPAADLIGPTWVLKEYTPPDGTPVTPPEEPESTVMFAVDDTLNAFGGCNTFGGTFQSDGKEIEIKIDSGTQLACEQTVMAQEQMFLQLLEEAEEYEVKENGDKMEMTAKRMIDDKEEDVIILAFHKE
jgi:ABC-type amino acid transport substrate-binding protein/heat shock protein HslJ